MTPFCEPSRVGDFRGALTRGVAMLNPALPAASPPNLAPFLLGDRQQRFQIVLTHEIRRHGVSFEAGRLRKGVANGALEFVISESAAIGGAEEPPVGSETSGGKFDELAVVFFGAEDLAFVVAREGGWIEDDAVEGAARKAKESSGVARGPSKR